MQLVRGALEELVEPHIPFRDAFVALLDVEVRQVYLGIPVETAAVAAESVQVAVGPAHRGLENSMQDAEGDVAG